MIWCQVVMMRLMLQYAGFQSHSSPASPPLLLQVRRNKRKQPKLQERYPRSDQPQPANGRGGSSEDKTTGGRSGGPDAGKRVLERGDDFERLPVPKAGRKKVRTAACIC